MRGEEICFYGVSEGNEESSNGLPNMESSPRL
jgi:hypothetical protein